MPAISAESPSGAPPWPRRRVAGRPDVIDPLDRIRRAGLAGQAGTRRRRHAELGGRPHHQFAPARHTHDEGLIACIEVGRNERDYGRKFVRINTQTPWGIESTARRSQFDVLSEQPCELSRDIPTEQGWL
jgi:hypothetical protein